MAFERAIICHQRKGIVAAMDGRTTAILVIGGSRLDELQPQKEEIKTRSLMPGVQTHDLGWSFQEVQLCGAHVMVAYREKLPYIYGLNDKSVN